LPGEIFVSYKQLTILPISRPPNFTKFEHKHIDRWGDECFRNRIGLPQTDAQIRYFGTRGE